MEVDNKQYCWHSSVVDYEVGAALVLRPGADDEDVLEVAAVPLSDLLEQTLELIGTNVNGNPYGNVMLQLLIKGHPVLISFKKHKLFKMIAMPWVGCAWKKWLLKWIQICLFALLQWKDFLLCRCSCYCIVLCIKNTNAQLHF